MASRQIADKSQEQTRADKDKEQTRTKKNKTETDRIRTKDNRINVKAAPSLPWAGAAFSSFYHKGVHYLLH